MNNFKGLYTALVTPFKDGKLDFEALERLIDRQIEGNVDGVVTAGCTGESATLTDQECKELLSKTVGYVKGRIKVIAGVGYNATPKTLEAANLAEKLGADGVMAITPYYNKPTQEGLYRHYFELHNNCDLPIILYTVPGRTGVDISDQLIFRLAELPRIVALKDASGDLEKPLRITAAIQDRITLLCGDDSVALAFNANGGAGLISAASNIIPGPLKIIQDLMFDNNYQEALSLHVKYIELYKNLFIESNPIPVKYALSLMGICSEELRLPLCELSMNNKAIVKSTMQKLGLLEYAA